MFFFNQIFKNFETLFLKDDFSWNSKEFSDEKNLIDQLHSDVRNKFNMINYYPYFISWMAYTNHYKDDKDYYNWKIDKNTDETVQWLGKFVNQRILFSNHLACNNAKFSDFFITQILAINNLNIRLHGYCILKCKNNCNIEILGNKNQVVCGNNSYVVENANGSKISVGKNSIIFSNRIYNQEDTIYRQICDTVFNEKGLSGSKKIGLGWGEYVPPRPDSVYHFPLIVKLGEHSSVVVRSHGKCLTFKSETDLNVNVWYKFNMEKDVFEIIT